MEMHATPRPASSQTAQPEPLAEPIEMVLIRVQSPACRLITRELRSVDRVLASWGTNASADIRCDFEIIFRDGYAFRGSYQLNSARHRNGSFRAYALREFAKLQDLRQGGASAAATHARQHDSMQYELQAD